MSLLLNGSKTITIAGTEMQCIEIYTGEAYTFPFAFTDSVGDPIDITGWTLGTSAKFYVADNVTYSTALSTIEIGNLSLDAPQPSTGVGTYSANLTATFTTAASLTPRLAQAPRAKASAHIATALSSSLAFP
jgi:hypothetical protein